MADNRGEHEVLPAGEMRNRYGLRAENRPTALLDPRRVPEPLRELIPMAERWGIADDLIRADLIERASAEEISALKRAVQEHDDLLDSWLAGPEADDPEPSSEYLAFSAMRMAADAA